MPELLRSPAAGGGLGPMLRRAVGWLRERARRIGEPLDAPPPPPDDPPGRDRTGAG
jgi:hypothetical protein